LAHKESTPTATAASTVYTASVTQEVSALPTRAPVSQIAQATGSEASPLILQANVDAQFLVRGFGSREGGEVFALL
jgi:hypothetical protein